MLGRRIPAARALEIGLVHQVVRARPAARRPSTRCSRSLLACAPLSVTSGEVGDRARLRPALDEALAIERECYERTLFTEDRDEGLAAFAEGRPPRYQGR